MEWGVAGRARPGAVVGGDLEVIRELRGRLLLGVVDGLGRGEEAAVAAKSAVAILTRYARQPLTSLVKRCHKNLMMTRGAALALASINTVEGRVVWLGVGNVEGLLVRASPEAKPARRRLPLHAGVVGYYLPVLHEHSFTMEPGDTLVVTSDGIRSDFEEHLAPEEQPQRLAEQILEHSFKGTDDALVLVARQLEPSHDNPSH